MIKFNYDIKQKEGADWTSYKPNIVPRELDNIVYIEAPNSSGKSTLLNIIALGCHGLSKNNLNPALTKKLHNLLDCNRNKCEFEIEVDVPGLDLTLKIKKDIDKKPIAYEIINNEKNVLSDDVFHRNYNLIYDIPDNPTERLNQLVMDIKDIQNNLGNRVSILRDYINREIIAIDSSRNPKRIKQFKESIAKLSKDKNKQSKILDNNKEMLDLIEQYTYIKYFIEYNTLCQNIEKDITDLAKQVDKKNKTKKKKGNKFNEKLKEKAEFIQDLEEKHIEISGCLIDSLPKSEQHILAAWKNINIKDEATNPEIANDLAILAVQLKDIFSDELEKFENNSKKEELNVCQELITILDKYSKSEIKVPGTNKPIAEFVSKLKDIVQRDSDLIKTEESYLKIISELNLIITLRAQAHILKDELKELAEEFNIEREQVVLESDNVEIAVKGKKDLLYKYKVKRDYYRKELGRKGIVEEEAKNKLTELSQEENIKLYKTWDEGDLKNKVIEMKADIGKLDEELKKKQSNITYFSKELVNLEDKRPHKYQNYSDKLNVLQKVVLNLEQKIRVKFNEYIQLYNNEKGTKSENYKNDPEQKAYYSAVSVYLGEKIGKIRLDGEQYDVKSIDLITGQIFTVEGRNPYLDNLGTGVSQSAYLTGLLNTQDDRKIIAMFDEVAMMDDNSLAPIYEQLTELNKQNRLVLGIIVQKGNQPKIISKAN